MSQVLCLLVVFAIGFCRQAIGKSLQFRRPAVLYNIKFSARTHKAFSTYKAAAFKASPSHSAYCQFASAALVEMLPAAVLHACIFQGCLYVHHVNLSTCSPKRSSLSFLNICPSPLIMQIELQGVYMWDWELAVFSSLSPLTAAAWQQDCGSSVLFGASDRHV